MMKINSKRTISAVLGTAMLLSAFLPIVASAKHLKKPSVAERAKGFCDSISSISSNVEKEVSSRESDFLAKRQTRLGELTRRRDKRDEVRDRSYSKWESGQKKSYAKFEARAKTDEQKNAVANFKSATDAAVLARKQAIEAAMKTFRDGMDQVIENRKPQEDAAVAGLRSSVLAATDKAKSDCANGVDSGAVRSAFNQSMKEARDKFQSDRKDFEKTQTVIMPLDTARKQAIREANADFKSATEKAVADLKAAFKPK